MSKYEASVIIPTYNRLQELEMTLDSLVNQRCRYPFEIIVTDDGSVENTITVVKKYFGKLNIRYCFQEDKGFRAAAARNMGIKLADGDICVFVDNGIILHSRAIEYHIEAHLHEKEPSVVLGYVYGFDIDPENQGELMGILHQYTPDEAISILTEREFYDIRENVYLELGDDLHKWPAPFIICWTCNLSVPKETLINIGMFDEYFNSWGGEDTDLGLSLQKNNIKYVLARKASSIHYPHEKNRLGQWGTNREEVISVLNAKKQYLLKKHPILPMERWMTVYSPVDLNKSLMEG